MFVRWLPHGILPRAVTTTIRSLTTGTTCAVTSAQSRVRVSIDSIASRTISSPAFRGEASTSAQSSSVKIRRRHRDRRREEHVPLEEVPAEVRCALEVAINAGPLAVSGEKTQQVRLAAVRSLSDLLELSKDGTTHRLIAAEDALHKVLQEVVGSDAPLLREAAAEALWNSWHRSENRAVDGAMRRGLALLEKQHMREAVDAFTEVTEIDPAFAEGWNKRATAFYLLKDFDKSIQDCMRALELKPRHFGALAGLGMCYQSGGDHKSALKWFKEALKVHPGLDGPRRVANLLEVQGVVNDQLRPRIVEVVQAMNDGRVPASSTPDSVACEWDIFHIVDTTKIDDKEYTYFIRVRIRMDADNVDPVASLVPSSLHDGTRGAADKSATDAALRKPRQVQGLARFYVLRFATGQIFPLSRLTEGQSSFLLAPGEYHRFAWRFVVAQELRDATGGMLLKHIFAESGEHEDCFAHATLSLLEPTTISPDEAERLQLGYTSMGQLDLRRLPLPSRP